MKVRYAILSTLLVVLLVSTFTMVQKPSLANGQASQEGEWIEYAFAYPSYYDVLTDVGEDCIAVAIEESTSMLFFDIYKSAWTEITFETKQTFHDLEAEGHIVFAYSDEFLIGYSSLLSQYDTTQYIGEPLHVNYEYGCSEYLAYFLTTERLYVFNADLGYWQAYDYGLPPDRATGAGAIDWVKEDYLMVHINRESPGQPKNIVYSQHTQSFNQLDPGCSNQGYGLDHGFTSADEYEGETEHYRLTGYSAYTNEFELVDVNEQGYLISGLVASDSKGEITANAMSFRESIPDDITRVEFYGYDTRLGYWSHITRDFGEHEGYGASWQHGGQFAIDSYLSSSDDTYTDHFIIYSGLTGEFSTITPGSDFGTATGEWDRWGCGGTVLLLADSPVVNACGYDLVTEEPALIPLDGENNVNKVCADDYATFARWSAASDNMTMYFYNSQTNNWTTTQMPKSTSDNSGYSHNEHLYMYHSFSPTEENIIFYSSIVDAYVKCQNPVDSSSNLFKISGVLAYAKSDDKSYLFDGEIGTTYDFDFQFNQNGLGSASASFYNSDTKTLYGYSTLSRQWTTTTVDETLFYCLDIGSIGLVATRTTFLAFTRYYAYNSLKDSWVELVPEGKDKGTLLGGKTALVVRSTKIYAFDPDGRVPDITVDPTSIDFGSVDVGSSSSAETITVTNDGADDLVIDSVNITGTDADQFSIQNDNCSGQTLTPGDSATLQVVFSPASSGNQTATLYIPSNDPDEATVNVSLSGTGGVTLTPDITVDPTEIDFGSVDVGSSSSAETITVTNDGDADLDISSANITGIDADQFSIQNDNCSGQTLTPGDSATLQLVFSPTSSSNQTATLSILSNDPDEATVNVNLSGSGTAVPVPSTVTLTTSPINITADGTSTSVLTASVTDQFGAPVVDGTDVLFTTDHGTFCSSNVTQQTLSGIATANLTSELSTESIIATVTATAGGVSDTTAVFFIPEGGVEAEESQTETITDSGEITDTPTGGDISIDATGEHSVTVAKYADNPGGTPAFQATDDYYDIHLDDDTGVNSLTVSFCPATPDTVIYYWDESSSSWKPCSDQSYSHGCIIVTITASTQPSLSDLAGLPFGLGTEGQQGGGCTGGTITFYMKVKLFSLEKNFRINFNGELQETIEATSTDGILIISIPKGTFCRDKSGSLLGKLEATLDNSPPGPPDDFHIIGPAYDLGDDGATFDPPITLTFTYDPDTLPERVEEEDLVLAFYDESTGEWVELECTVDMENHAITALVSHFTDFAVIGKVTPLPALLSVSDLSVAPREVKEGEAVTVTVTVTNAGGVEGTCNLILKVNGGQEAAQDVTIAAGEVDSTSFTLTREDAGAYEIDVNGLESRFTVITSAPAATPPPPPKEEEPAEPEETVATQPSESAPATETPASAPPAPPATVVNWALIGAVIGGVVVLVLLLYILVRRRRYS